MDGVHDMGGLQGFGPVDADPDEPLFHAEWERRTFAMTVACGFLGEWNIDISRDARERMEAVDYLRSSYYEHWQFGLERLLDARGLVTAAEIEARLADSASAASAARATARKTPGADEILKLLQTRVSASCEADGPPRYAVGDRVRARNFDASGHTRLPRYLRRVEGEVVRYQGSHIFPDQHARDATRRGEHLYAVSFAPADIWGEARDDGGDVVADLFEAYLEPVSGD